MTNKLDLRLLNNMHKEVTKVKSVEIPVKLEGRTQFAVIEIDEFFTESKIRGCVREIVSRIDSFYKMSGNDFDEVVEAFVIFMIIKHFTSFPAPDLYKEQVQIINMMIDTGLLHQIFSNINQDEIQKVREEIEFATERLEKGVEEYTKLYEESGLLNKLDELDENNEETN